MNFTYPAFLFATVAIAIPIIIHLFNFRKFKTVYFSNIRFLKEVQQETQSHSRLKQLLILTARILTVLFLVFAFAQPYLPVQNRKNNAGEKAISIFIDNSFSMDAINKNGTLLDEAKKRALEIISSYKPNDRFQLLTTNFEGKHQRLLTKEDFTNLLDEIKISPATRSLDEIISRQQDVLLASGNKSKISYILSDFQKSMVSPNAFKNDTTISINLVPLYATEKNNVYIDTCWFETPVRQLKQVEKLHVRINNSSDKEVENNSIKLFINGVQRTLASFTLDKNSQTEVVLTFSNKESGFQQCKLQLNDYPVTFDDTFYFSYEVSKNVSILCINPSQPDDIKAQSPFINNIYGTDSLFILKNTLDSKIEFAGLASYNLIILNELNSIASGLTQELKRFVMNGGSVLVFPSINVRTDTYNQLFTSMGANTYLQPDTTDTKVEQINLEHPIYKEVFDKKTFQRNNLDLPKVFSHYVFSKTTQNGEEYLLKLQNGDVFLSSYNVDKGTFYIAATPLNPAFSNFTKHALFVPTLYMIGINSQLHQPLFYTLGKDENIETNKLTVGENVYHVKNESTDFDVIPEHQMMDTKALINVHNQLSESGNYDLYIGKENAMPLSFNYNRMESDLSCYTADELQTLLKKNNQSAVRILSSGEKSLSSFIGKDEGKKLWKLCIILAMLFLACETLLLRLMK